jgi:hypothetical protein
MAETIVVMKERELARHLTLVLKIKKSKRVHFGLWLIKIGCLLSGISYQETEDSLECQTS